MECNACKASSDEQSLFVCDGCKTLLCKACANFTASEVKVMQLKERIMKFYCNNCLQSNTIKLLHSIINDKTTIIECKNKIIEVLEENIKICKENLMGNGKTAFAGNGMAVNDKSKIKSASKLETPKQLGNKASPRMLQKVTSADVLKKGLQNINLETSSTVGVSQTNLKKLEEKQRNIMEELINIEQDKINIRNTEEKQEFQEVRSRRKRRPNVGNGEGDGAFHGKNEKDRKIWLFISRVPDDVNDENIKNYIETRTNTNDVQVKKLPTHNSHPDNQSFMIGVQPHLQTDIYKSTFWPRKIIFDRFNFKRGRRFLDTNIREDGDISTQPISFLTTSM